MSKQSEELKALAASLTLPKAGRHDILRRLIVGGFFDEPRTSLEVVTEIRQVHGVRMDAGIMATYMKKFLCERIVRALRDKKSNKNLWILAADEIVKAVLLKLNSQGMDSLPDTPKQAVYGSTPHLKGEARQTGKLKILFLAANPEDETRLSLDRECREIESKIQSSQHRDGIELISKWAVRTSDLLQYFLQHKADVIHFSGHGSNSEQLIFLDSNEKAKTLSKDALCQLFTTLKDNIKVVVLNACYSRPQAEAIADVIDCVIGMNSTIDDEAAIVFAAAFYQAIGFGESVQKAFDSGKLALILEGLPEDKKPELLVRAGIEASKLFLV